MESTVTGIAFWLARASLGATLLFACALLAMGRVRQPARRQRLGELGLVAALLFAASCWAPTWLPLWAPAPEPPPTLEWVLVQANAIAPGDLSPPPAPTQEPRAALASHLSRSPDERTSVADWILPALVVAYGLGMFWFGMRWLLGVVALWRIVRAARPATPELYASFRQHAVGALAVNSNLEYRNPKQIRNPKSETSTQRRPCFGFRIWYFGFVSDFVLRISNLWAKHAGKRLSPRLLISDQLGVPVSCGILRPTVILPAALAEPAQAPERDWVFAHELTHLARRDAWSALLFALGQVLYFVLPWFWWLRRQVRLCQEYVADAAAAAARPADEYAEFLLSLTTAPVAPLGTTGVSGTKSDLYRRVTMLLQSPVQVETKCPRGWTAAAAALLLGVALVAAGVGPAQADPPNQKELLQQLDRIQAMLNELRGQVASPAGNEKSEKLGISRVPDTRPALGDDVRKSAVEALQQALRSLDLTEQAKQAADVEKQRAQAEKARDEARRFHALQIELENKTVRDPKVLTQKAEAEKERAVILWRTIAQAQNPAERADLRSVVTLLEKQMAQMKDGDKANKQLIQEAIDRLRDVLNKLDAAPAPPATRAVPVPPKAPGVVAYPQPSAVWSYTVPQARMLLAQPIASPHGRLGLRIDPPSALLAEQLNLPKGEGLVVAEVFDETPAKRAGIKVNDILLKINKQTVSNNPERLIPMVNELKADTPFDILILRKGKEETISGIKLPAPPQPHVSAVVRLAGHDHAGLMITAARTGNTVTLTRNEGPFMITLQAEIADAKHKVTSISIVEKGQTSKFAKIEEVPDYHRAKVQHLLQLLDSTDIRSWPQSRAPGSEGAGIQDLILERAPLEPLRLEVQGGELEVRDVLRKSLTPQPPAK
jgi:BlaR1 peptidase M56/PDZ domain-containing protein